MLYKRKFNDLAVLDITKLLRHSTAMATADTYEVRSPIDTEYKDLYDAFEFFEHQALPSTNTGSEPIYPLSAIWNTKWRAAASELVAGSAGGPPTSFGSRTGVGAHTSQGIETLADLFEPVRSHLSIIT